MSGPMAHNGMSATELHGVQWRKSARSGPQGNCVELARVPGDAQVAMRNSREPSGPVLVYSSAEAATLIRALKSGDFDDLLQDDLR